MRKPKSSDFKLLEIYLEIDLVRERERRTHRLLLLLTFTEANSSSPSPSLRDVLPRARAPPLTRFGFIFSQTSSNNVLPLGSTCPEFLLLDVLSGAYIALDSFEGYPCLCVAFIASHCPYVVHLADSFAHVAREYASKGAAVVAISPSSTITHPSDGPENMKQLGLRKNYCFPFLFDEVQKTAKAFGASCTPEFFVFQKRGRRPFELTYHGASESPRP